MWTTLKQALADQWKAVRAGGDAGEVSSDVLWTALLAAGAVVAAGILVAVIIEAVNGISL
ncbi:hypothetical protein FB566_0862 [Stackebrandtia endophytica]|uniref:Uncharacterized protein n=1 Tax=Stackebrandtia endophytica TaxID=1496996 RepID=A0A543AS11_9ACTN|nr:hypothetical protein [Stackebrandtia endophytica]TQL75364.1 hypothetical protein FB566_0862 [Stackebrandtia endophytica]